MPWKNRLYAAASALGLGLGIAATAFGAVGDEGSLNVRDRASAAEIGVIERGAGGLHRAISDHRADQLTERYRDLYAEARELEAAPRRNLIAAPGEPALGELEKALAGLRERVADAREQSAAGAGDVALVGGVSQATLDAIAACESGGDPTAVNAAGYYGKYQFDLGTWQSVGGSGNPAEASEAEQDMRASMLYAQAGSSPWPVCGA